MQKSRFWQQVGQITNLPPRSWQRLGTGVLLGIILAFTLGLFAPLLAQPLSSAAALANGTGAPPALQRRALGQIPAYPVDIDSHWARDCLRTLAAQQQLPLDAASAQFSPDDPATWQVTADLFNRVLPTETAYAGASPAEAALGLSSVVNVLYAYPPNYYNPNRAITRAEALTALAAKLKLPYVARARDLLKTSLADGAAVPAFGREGVASALAGQVMVNYPDRDRLTPNRLITRGEVAALACRASQDASLYGTIPADWVALPQTLPAQLAPATELRGVWLTNIDSNVLFSRENLVEGVARLKALNFNTLYPVVWNSGYTLYPSATGAQVLGKKQRLYPGDNPEFEATQRDRDMLREIIDLAHADGMAVIPWFEFGFMAPAQYDLLGQHPEWFTQRRDGTREVVQGAETFIWMNPFHPQVQQLLLRMVDEVLQTYEVEGIQFDDHLGLPVDMGYDPYTLALYRQEHNGASPPGSDSDPEWVRWRANKITEFVANLRHLIKSRRPEAILSISPNPYPFSYNQYLQDWPMWQQAGDVDELVIQVYRNDLDRFIWELNKPITEAARRQVPTAIGLLSGLRGRPTSVELLTQQLAATRDRAYGGISYFFYETLWVAGDETPEERRRQFQSAFATRAPRARP